MLLEPSDIREEWFETGDILHFCSVALIGAFLARLMQDGLPHDKREMTQLLCFCNACAAVVVGRHGALRAMPTRKEAELLLERADEA